MKWIHGDFILYDEPDRVDVEFVHTMLSETYWARGRSLKTVKDTVKRCLCFSLYDEGSQVGFARVLTDYATHAIILDVVIEKRCRKKGLGQWMMACISNHPDISYLKQVLWTRDADDLYRKFGFRIYENIRFMLKIPDR
jgi:GNAT superfamily N-acetyltransferase